MVHSVDFLLFFLNTALAGHWIELNQTLSHVPNKPDMKMDDQNM